MPTAEQAYIENLAWRAVNAPETIQANEQFAANQLAGAIDAAREQAKYIAAFSQPRSDLPTSYSPTFQSIQQQYESSRNRVVSGSGYVWQGEVKSSINPYPERSAAGIAWEVGRTGGAVDIGVAQRAIWEGAKPSEVLVAGIGGFGERINTSVQDLFTGASKIFGIEGVPVVQQQPASISTEQYMASLPTPFISTPSAAPVQQQQQSFDLLNFLGLGGGAVGQQAFQSAVSGQHPATVQQGGMGFGMPQYASDEIMRMSEGFGSAFWGGVSSIFGGGRGVSAGGGADIGSPMIQAPGIVTEAKLPGTATVYTPFGEYAQTAVEGAKLAIDPLTGELGIYQQTRAGNWMLVGGGGRAAVQSGMFSVEKPLTPVVYTQESGGGKFAPSADLYMAERVLAAPEAFSRLGAEAYGGFVQPLDSRTLTPESRVSTYSDIYNLANYAQPLGVNLGKAAAPGANIPWQLPAVAGAVSFMGPEGLTGVGASLPGTIQPTTTYRPATDIGTPFFATTTVVHPAVTPSKPWYEDLGSAFGSFISFVQSTSPSRQEKPMLGISESMRTFTSGGNETITQLGATLEATRPYINQYNQTQVAEYNANVEKYNAMSKQNPLTTTTEYSASSASQQGAMTGEQKLLSGIYGGFSLPSSEQITGLFGKAGEVGSTLFKAGAGAVVGSVGYAYAAPSVAYGELPFVSGAGAGFGETIVSAVSANPVGWGAGLGILGAYGLEKAGRLGVTGPTEQFSVRTAGEYAGSAAYTTGYTFAGEARTGLNKAGIAAQELWEGVGGAIQTPGAYNLPKITDVIQVPVFQAPGEGFGQIVSLPSRGAEMVVNLPGVGREMIAKVGEAIPGAIVGWGVIQMPKPTITPEDVISPSFGIAPTAAAAEKAGAAGARVISERPIFDLSVGTAAKSTVATREAVVSQFVPDYATRIASEAAAMSRGVATPYWWTKVTYASKAQEATIPAMSSAFSMGAATGMSYDFARVRSVATQAYPVQIAMPTLPAYDFTRNVRNVTNYNYEYGYKWYPSGGRIDTKLELPSFGWGGGSAGGSMGGRKRRAAFIETFTLGLDIGFMNRRPKRAKSYKSPKKPRKVAKRKK